MAFLPTLNILATKFIIYIGYKDKQTTVELALMIVLLCMVLFQQLFSYCWLRKNKEKLQELEYIDRVKWGVFFDDQAYLSLHKRVFYIPAFYLLRLVFMATHVLLYIRPYFKMMAFQQFLWIPFLTFYGKHRPHTSK